MSSQGLVDEMPPSEAFDLLRQIPDSALVDVRTVAEWSYVGLPDPGALNRPLITVEWVSFPSMEQNRRFYEELCERSGGQLPGHLFFICRSGARSLAAASLVAERALREGETVKCTNVSEGFEGDLDNEGHRGMRNGWKAAGLPWRQN